MSTFVIRVDGVDITDDVIIADAEFITQATGGPGLCRFRVKDVDMAYMFTVGKELTLDVDGRRMWGGFILSVSRNYFFPVDIPVKPRNPCDPIEFTERALLIEGADYNILLRKRVIFDKADPTNSTFRKWPAGENDDTIIRYMCEHYLDLDDDGIDYTTRVERVGTPNPDEKSTVFGPGYTWEDAMQAIAWMPGAVYYIDPDKKLVYTDVDTPNASHELSDHPTTTQVGYRDMELLRDGTKLVNDALVWGVGQGSQQATFSRVTDTASVAEHGRWQFGDFRHDLWRQASVDRRANSIVYGSPQNKRGGNEDAVSAQITVKVPYFRVAEKAVFESEVFSFTDVIPIRRQRITFVSPTDALYQMTLSHHIDQPWNTVEFYLPPFPTYDPPRPPQVIISDPDPDYPMCPYPGMEDAVLVFSERWERPTNTQPPTSAGGLYTLSFTGYPPAIQDNAFFFSGGGGSELTVWLDQYCHSPAGIVAAYDGRGFTTTFNMGVGFGSASASVSTAGVVTLQAPCNSVFGTGPGTGSNEGTTFTSIEETTGYVNPAILKGRFYAKLKVASAALYTGVKIWPQDEAEPTAWNAYLTGSPTPNPPFSTSKVYASHTWRTVNLGGNAGLKLEAFDVYGGQTHSDPRGSLMSSATGVSGGLWEGSNGWELSMGDVAPIDFIHYVSPNTAPYMNVVEGNYTNPFYQMTVHRNQFFPNPESGYISNVTHRTPALCAPPLDTSVNVGTSYRAVNTAYSVTITGRFTVNCSASALATPGDNFDFPIAVEFASHGIGANTGNVPPYAYPYTLLGTNTATLQDPGGTYGGPDEWTWFEVAYAGGALRDGRLHWSARLQDPANLLGIFNQDPRYYGSFSLPNTKTATIKLDKLNYWVKYNVLPRGQSFCIPQWNGGTDMSKRCDTVSVPGGWAGGPKFISVLHPYMPGTAEMYIDGLMLRPGFDFTEYSPDGKLLLLFSDVSDARLITTCYIPR